MTGQSGTVTNVPREAATVLAIEIDILGPVIVRHEDTVVRLERRQHRVVLGVLALRSNQRVSSDRLAELLWAERAPRRPRAVLHSRVCELRAALAGLGCEPDLLLRTDGDGYLLQVSPPQVDAHRFLGLVGQARAEPGPERARLLLRRALALWRGSMLGGLPEDTRVRLCHPMESARLSATEELYELELRLGAHRAVVDELLELSQAHPGRERIIAATMSALHRTGRAAEAVLAYDRCRRWHADTLGIDPGIELQRLHVALLRGDTDAVDPRPAAVVPDPAAPAPAAAPVPVPAQLPGDVAGFVGREAHLDVLRQALTGTGAGTPIVTLAGPPGVGKTALAVHLGHTVAPSFPDGQLFVDLRGYSAERPLAADEVLHRFLRDLGVPPDRIPRDRDEKSVLLRSVLTGRRVLVVLDNAASPDQVRPLLPPGPGCALVVTSRDQLRGLTAVDGARLVLVPTLSDQEADLLLASVLGRERTDAEPEAVAGLIEACGRLPLALRIAAAHLAALADQDVAVYLDRIRSTGRLAALRVPGDDRAAVERAIELSYRKLDPEAARLLRLLGLVPGADLDPYAASTLAGIATDAVNGVLDRLVTLSLVQSRGPDRLGLHDLIRDFARARSAEEDDEQDRAAAARRLFDHYLGVADAAGELLHRGVPRAPRPARSTDVARPPLTGPAAALGWLDAEVINVVSAIDEWSAGPGGLPVWLLADAFYGYFMRLRHNAFWLRTHTVSLAVATAAHHPAAEAWTGCGLANYEFQHGRNQDAEARFLRAAETFARLGDARGEARAHNGLGMVDASRGDFGRATGRYRRALALFRATGEDLLAATVACNLGNTLVNLGELDQGLALLDEARATAETLGAPHTVGRAVTGAALVPYQRGDPARSRQEFGRALALWTDLGVTTGQSESLRYLAAVELDLGRPHEAVRLARRALELGQHVDDPWMVNGARLVIGEALLAIDRVTAAAAQFEEARVEGPEGRHHWHAWATVGLAACRRSAGDPGSALALATDASADGRPYVRCLAALERARAYAAAGRRERARAQAAEVLATSRRYGYLAVAGRAAELLRVLPTHLVAALPGRAPGRPEEVTCR